MVTDRPGIWHAHSARLCGLLLVFRHLLRPVPNAPCPHKFAGVLEAKVTLTVEAIDKVGRTIVLKDDKGEQSKFVVGDQAKNFDQIKVGDLVVISYTQELLMTLVKGGGQLRERIDSGQQGMAAPGQMPGAFESKEVAFVADVQQVDRRKGTVTLRGALRTVTLKIKDPQQLKLINKGDQVEGVFSEAMAIAVVPAGAKARK
jgi:Cu/Ag efflux protein CusF